MSETIGVQPLFLIPNLKRAALFFNRIGVFPVSFAGEAYPNVVQYYDEVDWLIEQGILFDAEKAVKRFQIDPSEEGSEDLIREGESLFRADAIQENRAAILQNHLARTTAFMLRRDLGVDVLPIVDPFFPTAQAFQTKRATVASIILGNFPVPNNLTPWERIIEFRNDLDSFGKFLDLRNWMNEVASGQLPVIEIEQKLEYLISQYRRHMSLHEMEANTGVLQTIVISTAEILEQLVTLKWGKLARSLFSIRDKNIALLKGELTSPGSEIAYIIKARETFRP